MACGTSIKQEKKLHNDSTERGLESMSYMERAVASGTENDLCEFKGHEVSEAHGVTEQRPRSQHAPFGSRTMLVHLRIPNKKGQSVLEESTGDEELVRKSPAQKELNSVQRKQQIADYNSLKHKEERQQRYELRRGGELSTYSKDDADLKRSSRNPKDEESKPTKRRKRVSFEF